MQVLDHAAGTLEHWRPGVTTRMRMSAVTGAVQLCIFEQWCETGTGAPTHLHAVEEVLSVLTGEADLWIEDDHATVRSGQSVVVPAGRRHDFRNSGAVVLHVIATLAAPFFEASFDDRAELSRRWVPRQVAT